MRISSTSNISAEDLILWTHNECLLRELKTIEKYMLRSIAEEDTIKMEKLRARRKELLIEMGL